MRYLSSDNIKTAAAQQPNPAREKNLLGKILWNPAEPYIGGALATVRAAELGNVAHNTFTDFIKRKGFNTLAHSNSKLNKALF